MVTKTDSSLIVHDGGTIKDVLDAAKPIANYTALRAYTGSATQVRITSNGIAGFFYRDDADTTSTDNGGTVIVSSNGKRWKRLFDGAVNVKWFGAVGNGIVFDDAALQAALNSVQSGGTVEFDGIYRLSDNSNSGTQTKLTLSVSGTTLRFSERTKFLIKSDAGITECMRLVGVSHVRTEGTLHVESDATTPYTTNGSRGAKALVIQNANGATCGNISIDAVHLIRGSGGVFIQNTYDASNRVDGVRFGKITTIDATYGLNSQNNGDNISFELLQTCNAFRSFFIYGARNYKGKVEAFDQYISGTPINITQFSPAEGGSSVNPENIDLDVSVDGGTPGVVASVRHIGDAGETQFIKDVFIRFSGPLFPPIGLQFLNFDVSGGPSSSIPFAAKIENIVFYCATTKTQFDNPLAYTPCSWVSRPTIFWTGPGQPNISKWTAAKTALSLNTYYGTQLLGNSGAALPNGAWLYGQNATGAAVELARVDSANNLQYGVPSSSATYSAIYSGSNGVYFSVNGASRFQATDAHFRPQVDNAYVLGSSALRWSAVYAGTGAINTSDERNKQQIRMLSDVERAVAVRCKGLIRAFKFNDAVQEKTDAARWHFGVIAQDVKNAFEAEGLDGFSYGLLCYDRWEASSELLDDDGGVVEFAREAGDRYGVRYDELLAFIIAAL